MNRGAIINAAYVVVRMRISETWVDGRRLSWHGQFGSLEAVPIRRALELVEAGHAKLPAHQNLRQLREALAESEAAA